MTVGESFAFLSGGEMHQEVALQARPQAMRADPEALGLYHVAFEVGDEAAFGRIAVILEKSGAPYARADHGISKALYFQDPDGNGIEVYVDTRDRRSLWLGRDEPVIEMPVS